MDIATNKTTTVFEQTVVKLDRNDVMKLLANAGIDCPPDAQITVQVPGGGDWSHCDLDISDENPIMVQFTNVTTAA